MGRVHCGGSEVVDTVREWIWGWGYIVQRSVYCQLTMGGHGTWEATLFILFYFIFAVSHLQLGEHINMMK